MLIWEAYAYEIVQYSYFTIKLITLSCLNGVLFLLCLLRLIPKNRKPFLSHSLRLVYLPSYH